jgi:hypothetical protein
MALNEKSALEGIDVKTAAYNMMKDFRDYRNLGGLRRVIENAEKQLSALGPLIRENQQAITTLTRLHVAGFSEKDIGDLATLVSIWNKSMAQGNDISSSMNRKLDTEMIEVGNLQQTSNNNPGSNNGSNGNNGCSGPSLKELVRLNLLRNSTANMLHRVETKY